MKTDDGLVKLAEEFGIDVDKLKGLVRFVNSPSVDKASKRRAPGSKKGEDLWVANVGSFFFLVFWRDLIIPPTCGIAQAVWVEAGIRS